jgi:hypothetical protein
VLTIDDLLGALRLEQVGDDRYRATNADAGHGVIFGGQLLAQSIIAGLDGHDDKQVKTVHTVFARGGKPDLPVEIDVDRMHRGRAFASSTVTIRQGERLCTRSLVLLTADEPDFIRHADPAPTVPVPERPGREAPESGDTRPDGDVPPGHDGGDWQVRIAGDVDIDDPGNPMVRSSPTPGGTGAGRDCSFFSVGMMSAAVIGAAPIQALFTLRATNWTAVPPEASQTVPSQPRYASAWGATTDCE